MMLYRLAHKDVALSLHHNPLSGCTYFKELPYLYVFDSAAAALLESSIFRTLRVVPRSFYVIEYFMPSESLHKIELDAQVVYGDYATGNYYLGTWVEQFLKGCTVLVAAFPSKYWHWAKVNNYVINPQHELFKDVKVNDIYLLSRVSGK